MPKRPANVTSYSEMSTLAQCEMKHHLRYREGIQGDDSPALQLGRLLDVGINALLKGEDWEAVLRPLVTEEGADPSFVDLDAMEGPPSTAAWLIRRYAEHYDITEHTIVETQLDLTAKIPGTAQVHRAIIDEVWQDDRGDLWMVERKSYGRTDRLQLVDVDPQLTLNLWVAQQNGYACKGIVFDGIYTYRWKPEKPTQKQVIEEAGDSLPRGANVREWARAQVEAHPGVERPVSESFSRLWLDRHDDHIAAAIDEVKAGIQRRNALRRGAKPLRNIGPLCNHCGQRSVCFERLAFPQNVLDIDLDEP